MNTTEPNKEKEQYKENVSAKNQPLLARVEQSKATQVARLIAPWATLISTFGFILLITLFIFDRANNRLYLQKSAEDRVQTRIAESWQILTLNAPGNNGKITALEYLNNQSINLTGIDLSSDPEQPPTWLVAVKLNGADLSEANLSSANLKRADFNDAILVNSKFIGSDLSNADLKNANLTDADLNGINLTRADLGNSALIRADLRAAQLGSANLSEANLSDANLSEAYLIATDLSGADLRFAHLIDAEMIATNLSGANLSGAHMIGANLIGAVLDGACGNESTSYPEGFVPLPVCDN